MYTDDEYSAFVDEETFAARPDHLKEINYFKEPRNGRVISTNTLVSFCIFSYNEQHHLCASLPCPDGIPEGAFCVVDDGQQYHVLVDGDMVASVDDYLASAIEDPPHILMPQRSSLNLTEEFNTPDFGITVCATLIRHRRCSKFCLGGNAGPWFCGWILCGWNNSWVRLMDAWSWHPCRSSSALRAVLAQEWYLVAKG